MIWILLIVLFTFVYWLFFNYQYVFEPVNQIFVKLVIEYIPFVPEQANFYFENEVNQLAAFSSAIILCLLIYFIAKKTGTILISLFIPVYIVVWFILAYLFGYYDLMLLENVFFSIILYIVILLFLFLKNNETNNFENKEGLKKIYNQNKWTKNFFIDDFTVMFVDLKNFTSISEELGDPRIIWGFLNSCNNSMEQTILKYWWYIDKYMWDGILAVFHWEGKESNAVACGLHLLNHKEEFIKKLWEKVYNETKKKDLYKQVLDTLRGKDFDIKIWIASWNVLMWPIWWKHFKTISVIWNIVNLAARIEQLNNFYHTSLLCDKKTSKNLWKNFLIRIIDRVRVKWKSQNAEIFHPIKNKEEWNYSIDLWEDEITQWNSIIKKYFNKDFEKAYEELEKYIVENSKDPTANVLYDRINKIINNKIEIPPNWDWTFEHTKKS